MLRLGRLHKLLREGRLLLLLGTLLLLLLGTLLLLLRGNLLLRLFGYLLLLLIGRLPYDDLVGYREANEV